MSNTLATNHARNHAVIGGWILSGLAIVFLLMDATMKLMALPIVTETSGSAGHIPIGIRGASTHSHKSIHSAPFLSALGG